MSIKKGEVLNIMGSMRVDKSVGVRIRQRIYFRLNALTLQALAKPHLGYYAQFMSADYRKDVVVWRKCRGDSAGSCLERSVLIPG